MSAKRKESAQIPAGQLLLVAAQLALALFVMARFELEPTGRLHGFGIGWIIAAPVALFLVHALLPLAARKPLLLAATGALFYLLLGPTATAYVVVGGLALIGICHLPLRFRWRVLAIGVVALCLALCQARLIGGSRLLLVALPVLGSLFMFRLIIYLYDIRHERPGEASFIDRLGYFFLTPAPLFPFFPTLDYKVYLRCFYARPAFEIYQTGALWISRGVTHLLLYRVIYQFFSPPAEYVVDLGGVMAFCLSGYLIYLRVSGVFHIIGGLLRLCGYDLPETHRLYFFATGFSDYWRRINIYWKDFMAKVFFFPTFAALRGTRFEQPARVAVATAVVFAATTVLHSYQTFWLRGEFKIHQTDYLFWGILGVLVIANNLLEGRRKSGLPGAQPWSLKAAASTSAKATGMFVFLCVLWALWSSNTLSAFFEVMAGAANARPWHLAMLFGFCAAAVVLGTLGQWVAHKGFNPFVERPRALRSVLTAALPLLLLAGLWEYHHAVALPGKIGRKFEVVRRNLPNERDQINEERGYYEVLMASGAAAKAAAEADEFIKVRVDDIRGALYEENYGPEVLWGATWSTNRWRMRDQLYSKRKPAGVTRIAISGASYVMGRGVADGETFESVAEAHLETHGADVQMLNFAMSATCTLQRLADLELRIVEFEPDYFFLFCHRNEAYRNLRKIAQLVRGGHDPTYDFLRSVIEAEGITAGQTEEQIIRTLRPHADEILQSVYQRIAEVCKANDIVPVWIYLPMVTFLDQEELAEEGRAFAQRAGLRTIELHGVYDDYTLDDLKVSADDQHPNRLAHRLIARRLIDEMKVQRAELGLPGSIDDVPPLLPPSR